MARSTSNSALVAALLVPAIAGGDPLRLRGDAFASAQAPAGLLTLEAADRTRPWLDAEASVWFGANDDTRANALIIAVRMRDPKRRGSLKVGRQLVFAGALRPLHVDGADAVVKLPDRASLEVFGGIPVEGPWNGAGWNWVTGAHYAQVLDEGTVGVGWLEQREHGELATHEVGFDLGLHAGERIDYGGAAAIDMISIGLAEARASGVWRNKSRSERVEVFAVRRSPSHLLPATSLFSVLGDVPATRTGATGKWRAAPRLDVEATVAVRVADEAPVAEEDLAAGTRLRLDDRGASSLGLELRRQGAPDGGWTGARGSGRIALSPCWTTSGELELVMPDTTKHGELWPWALGAVTWRPAGGWELAGAVEASATAQYSSRVDVLVRLSRALDIKGLVR